MNAVEGEREIRTPIRQELCIKCGVCYDACRFDAIETRSHERNRGEDHFNLDGQRCRPSRGRRSSRRQRRASASRPSATTPRSSPRALPDVPGGGGVHGRKRSVTSCNYEAERASWSDTNSERLQRSRKMTIELLLARCPESGPAAPREGVQGQAPRFDREGRLHPLRPLRAGVPRAHGRGSRRLRQPRRGMRVDTPYERKSEACITCGACTFVCPTGSKRLGQAVSAQARSPAERVRHGHAAEVHDLHPVPAGPAQRAGDRPRELRSISKMAACGTCAEVCPPKAIDYEQKDEVVRVETGAVILAPGFCLYDPVQKPEYSYGLAPNVLSSLQFERLLSASGP